jgi:hypothetical protein
MRSLSVFCVLMLCAGFALGQSAAGTITGTVSDPTSAVIPNSPVEARNTGTGTIYKAATSGTGNYTISELPVGTYEVSVTAAGFKKAVRTGIEVLSSTTFRVDFALQIGAATESVTITAEAPLLKTESGELSHNVSVNTLDNLPILTIGSDAAGVRNPLASLSLLPGASFVSDNTLRINGMPSSSQSIRIEGQDATNGFWKEQNSTNQTGVDAIQEVAIQTSNFAAEFGQAGGGYINYTMRSGTNQYHGSGFDYLANEAFNAGTPFTDAGLTNSLRNGQHVRNRLRRQDFGGTFGGPVRIPKIYNGTDKTFFFVSYEQYIQNSLTTNGLNSVPTAAYRNGDFSAALNPQLTLGGVAQTDPLGAKLFGNQIFDPNTQQVVNGQVVRTPFPNNVIPVTRLDATALKVQALLPLATNPAALVNNYAVPAYTNFTHTEIPTLKLDHNLSPSQKVSVFYSANRVYSPAANGYTQVFSSVEPTNQLSQTTRVSYDQTISPRLLMHMGAGLVQTTLYNLPANFDQTSLFGSNTFYVPQFPAFTGISDTTKGGNNITLGTGFGAIFQKDTKPTFVTSFTWVKGNHTFKFGGEAIFEGLPIANTSRSNGQFGFGQAETADPFGTGLTFANGATGFGYASFLLGAANSLALSPQDTLRLGNHTFGLYAQDSWKVSRRLTIDYGLRYDYATLLSEQHGRMQDAAFGTPNPAAGGRLGAVIYGGNTTAPLNGNYPWALGPRLGIAYQVGEKTVIRFGSGLSYGTSPNNSFLSYSVPDFYTFSDQNVAGVPAAFLKDGNPYSTGNRFGNAPLVWPDFSAHYPSQVAPGYSPPQSPFISIDRNGGRLPRILQWSLGIQREVAKGLVVDAAYVGNRGVWWTAPLLATYNYNALTPASIQAAGLTTADLGLLTTPITSPLVQARFPNLKIVTLPSGLQVVPSVYPTFPATQQLGQALRPYPQWNGVPPFLGPPLGDTWYDSLQAKVTKRYSHGLDVQYAFTWQKELANGANSDTSYLTPNPPRINDVFNYAQNKQISGYSRPLVSILSFNYRTPRLPGDGKGLKAASWVTKDWVIGAVLRYQSGAVLPTASSNNNFLNQMQRGVANNPALWGGGTTFQNLVPGQALFLQDPNCHCFDPTKTLVLNPAAWSDVAAGQYGNSAPYLNNYRWQRQPAESMSFGRIFPIAKEGTINLNVRIEFQNIFNRTFLAAPSAANPTAPLLFTNQFANGATGALSSGFGFVNSVNGGGPAGAQPRSGQIVARFSF